MAKARVSLADVAKHAGVSSNTVSRVVRGDREVSDATRRRVTELIERLGYRPNLAARALAANRVGIVHVLLTAKMYHGHAQTFLSIMSAATEAGLHVSASYVHGVSETVRRQQGLLPIKVDGVLIIGGQGPSVELATSLGGQIPTVLLLTGEHGLDQVSTVSVDNAGGARLATEHLISRGITDLVHMAGPADWLDAMERMRGFTEVCEAHGLEPKVVNTGSWNAIAGYEAGRAWRRPPGGLFASNDQLALGAIRAMLEAGAQLPQDCRVVGYDDAIGAACFFPPLSTVRQPFDEVGKTAVALLRSLIDSGETQDTIIEPQLVIRASSD